MSDINFVVDEKKCIHCGICVKDCISYAITMNENKIPEATAPENCIKCQHCLSICPAGAISILNKIPENSEPISAQTPDIILNLIKSRRSQRQYKTQNLDKETLQKLKDMLAYIPTGCNYHKLHFSFIEDIEVMNEFRKYTLNKIISALTKKPIKALVKKFSKYTSRLINGEDIIFRDAPHILVVSNPINAPCKKEDAIIALSYFELYANSLGIGTCWCGFGNICFKFFPELSEYMKIPEGYQPQYVMLFGLKEVNYSRTIQPENYNIVSAEKNGFEKLSAMKKAKRYFWNLLK